MESKTRNSSLNFIFSVLSQITNIVLAFIVRTVFIKCLGVEYLGLNGLFTNIISVLSLAELGVSSAIIYSMYKPVSENDTDKICQLINYYKKLYSIIALVVLAVGLAFFPFLDFFINLESDVPNVKYYYFLFLGQTVSSYLIVYRTSVLTAYQKDYIISRTAIISNVISYIGQIVVLLLFKNYVIYMLVAIICTFLCNAVNSIIASKRYPFINNKKALPKDEQTAIWNNIKSMFAYKLGSVILNNTDNLLISKLVNTLTLGFYSNYCLIIDKIAAVVNLIFTSLQASLGNYNVKSSPSQKYFMFKVISFIEYWVYGFCCICFCLLIDVFIEIWLGSNYQLDMIVVYICVFNFYLKGVLYPLWCFRNTTGMFKDTKYTMFIAATINIVLSVVLGLKIGLVGILLATAIARICTNIWYEPLKLFKNYFGQPVFKYYVNEIIRILFLIVLIIISHNILSLFTPENLYLTFLIRILYCLFVPNFIFILLFFRTAEFKYVLEKIRFLLNKK